MEKIKYKELSTPIQIAIIISYIIGALYLIAFITGFIGAIIE